MNLAQQLLKSLIEKEIATYRTNAAHTDPKYVKAVAKQVAHRKLRSMILHENKRKEA